MSYKTIEIDWLEEVIAPALDQFYATPEDHDLIVRGVNERTIVASIYRKTDTILRSMQEKREDLRGLVIDVEYNRNFYKPKYVFQKCADCSATNGINHSRSNQHVESMPDLIIHHRGSNENNQVVMEFKKASNQQNREVDEAKLTYFTCQKPFPNEEEKNYQYLIGLFIDLGESEYVVTIFRDAKIVEVKTRRNGRWF